jgi:FSR family fosmidomycin resistance protein-like MFS transporter
VGSGEEDWGAFTRLSGLIAARSVVHFGIQAFVPAFFVAELATSKATANAALTLFLASGAVGTLVGGGLVDRWGARTVLIGTMVAVLPPLLLLPVVGEEVAMVLVGVIGFFTIASFSVTVVLGQAYLPHHLGLASGVTLGLAIGLGGVSATALGVVADQWGLHAVLWVIAAAPIPAILLAVSLPAIPGIKGGSGRSPSLSSGVHRDGLHAAPPQRVADRRSNA